MITLGKMSESLWMLEMFNLITGTNGKEQAWLDFVSNAEPLATDDDIMGAVKAAAQIATPVGSNGYWFTSDKFIAEVRAVVAMRIELQEIADDVWDERIQQFMKGAS